jgi:hypothetical protein
VGAYPYPERIAAATVITKQQRIACEYHTLKEVKRHLRACIICLVCISGAPAQQQTTEAIIQSIEKGGCTLLQPSGAKVCRYDYQVDGRAVEALSFQPAGDGPFPGILMIPGYQRTAKDLIPLGTRLAAEGFAGISVSQPGFGRSQGPADYVGPKDAKSSQRRLSKTSARPRCRFETYGDLWIFARRHGGLSVGGGTG